MFVRNWKNFHQCVPLILYPQEWDTQTENFTKNASGPIYRCHGRIKKKYFASSQKGQFSQSFIVLFRRALLRICLWCDQIILAFSVGRSKRRAPTKECTVWSRGSRKNTSLSAPRKQYSRISRTQKLRFGRVFVTRGTKETRAQSHAITSIQIALLSLICILLDVLTVFSRSREITTNNKKINK